MQRCISYHPAPDLGEVYGLALEVSRRGRSYVRPVDVYAREILLIKQRSFEQNAQDKGEVSCLEIVNELDPATLGLICAGGRLPALKQLAAVALSEAMSDMVNG